MPNYNISFSGTGVNPVESGSLTVTAGGGGPVANPLLLPLSASPNVSAYNAFNIPSQLAGFNYPDPGTGTIVVKATDSTWFASSIAGPDYARPGRIGRGDASGNYYFLAYNNSGGGRQWRIGIFNINTRTITKGCTLTDGTQIRNELCGYFSPTTAGIFYAITSGSIIRKFNVTGPTAVEITGGGFPKNMSAFSGGQSNYSHFNVSADDRWFSFWAAQTGPYIGIWDSLTDTPYLANTTGRQVDEPQLDPNGRFLFLKTVQTTVVLMYDPVTNIYTSTSPLLASPTHPAIARGFAYGLESNGGSSRWWRISTTGTPDYAAVFDSPAPGTPGINTSGGWWDQASDANQWGITSSPGNNIACFRLSGGTNFRRVLVHHYSLFSVGDGYHGSYIWPSLSPDGRVCYYMTDMNGSARCDGMIAIMPTS